MRLRRTNWRSVWRCSTDRPLGSGTAIGIATMQQCSNATMRRRSVGLRGTNWLSESRCRTNRPLGSGTAIGNATMQQCHNEVAIGGAVRDKLAERMTVPKGQAAGKWHGNRECHNATLQQCHNEVAIGGAARDELAGSTREADYFGQRSRSHCALLHCGIVAFPIARPSPRSVSCPPQRAKSRLLRTAVSLPLRIVALRHCRIPYCATISPRRVLFRQHAKSRLLRTAVSLTLRIVALRHCRIPYCATISPRRVLSRQRAKSRLLPRGSMPLPARTGSWEVARQ